MEYFKFCSVHMKGAVPGLLLPDSIMRKAVAIEEGQSPGGRKRQRRLRTGQRFNCTLLFKRDPRLFSWDIKQCSAKLSSRSIPLIGLAGSRCRSEEWPAKLPAPLAWDMVAEQLRSLLSFLSVYYEDELQLPVVLGRAESGLRGALTKFSF